MLSVGAPAGKGAQLDASGFDEESVCVLVCDLLSKEF
jgi:hypothetical protein